MYIYIAYILYIYKYGYRHMDLCICTCKRMWCVCIDTLFLKTIEFLHFAPNIA